MVRHRLRGYHTPRPFGREDLNRDVEYSIGVVEGWRRVGLEATGRRILEVGPGPDLGTGFVLVALGAESYTAIDRFPLARDADRAFYAALAERLGVDVAATFRRIRYVVSTVPPTADLGESYDAFVSNATLEHLNNVRAAFGWMASVAAPGATHAHLVDAQTHMRWVRPRDPWNILRYPDRVYGLALAFPGSPNRLLASDYVREANRAGIRLAVVGRDRASSEYVRRVRPFLARRFRHRDDDLQLLTFMLVSGPVVDRMPNA